MSNKNDINVQWVNTKDWSIKNGSITHEELMDACRRGALHNEAERAMKETRGKTKEELYEMINREFCEYDD